MNTIEKFESDNYVIQRKLIGSELIENLEMQFKMHRDNLMLQTNNDRSQFYDGLVVDNCFCWYAPVDYLLVTLKSKIENITGVSLTPTYTFGRIYYKNAIMKEHVDRPACEISATINISIDKTPWPIWVKNKNGVDIPIELFPGDALIYRGQVVPHWRNPYTEGEEQVQFFLHWVDSNGQSTGEIYDRRQTLGLPCVTMDQRH
jgi:hypothetical protein